MGQEPFPILTSYIVRVLNISYLILTTMLLGGYFMPVLQVRKPGLKEVQPPRQLLSGGGVRPPS